MKNGTAIGLLVGGAVLLLAMNSSQAGGMFSTAPAPTGGALPAPGAPANYYGSPAQSPAAGIPANYNSPYYGSPGTYQNAGYNSPANSPGTYQNAGYNSPANSPGTYQNANYTSPGTYGSPNSIWA